MKFHWNQIKFTDDKCEYFDEVCELANLGEEMELHLSSFWNSLPKGQTFNLKELLRHITEIDSCRINIQQIMIDLTEEDTVVEDVHLLQLNVKEAREGIYQGNKLKFSSILKYYSTNQQFLSALHSSLDGAIKKKEKLPTLLEKRARLWVEPIKLIQKEFKGRFKKLSIGEEEKEEENVPV